MYWHYLQHNLEIKSSRNSIQINKLIEDTKLKINKIRKKIDMGEDFLPKESILCNWCYYWEECSAKNGSNPYI